MTPNRRIFKAILSYCLLFSLWIVPSSYLSAQDPLGLGTSNNDDEFLPVEQAYQPDLTLDQGTLAVDWIIAPGYYLYKDKFKFEMQSNGGLVELDNAQYQKGTVKYDDYYEKDVESFYNHTVVSLPVADLPETFNLKVKSQGCADAGLCYPPRSQYFRVDTPSGSVNEIDKATFNGDNANDSNTITTPAGNDRGSNADLGNLPIYILFALMGGILLNLMPCVFPVLSLKALSFASSRGSDHAHHLHGWAYTIGVIISFIVVALIIFAAKAAGQQTGWGFQLQSPQFVAAMAFLFIFMGLSLSGLVQIGGSLMGVGQSLTTQKGLRGSFFTGILAAVVASPCTGPLMAPALGFALTQPPLLALSVFVALGFGLALPFLLLSYSPKLANLLPKPGAWMEKLKELLAFPMYLTAAWLVFVFGRQVGMTGVFFLSIAVIALVFAIWLLQHQPSGRALNWTVKASSAVCLLFVGYVIFNGENFRTNDRTHDELWSKFSEEKVKTLRAEGQAVFVDFTADWCITCKANKAMALSRKGFLKAVETNNVALLVADWTNEDPEISKVLEKFQRSGVPLYLMYSANESEPPEVLPQILTQSMVIEAIERNTANR